VVGVGDGGVHHAAVDVTKTGVADGGSGVEMSTQSYGVVDGKDVVGSVWPHKTTQEIR